MSSIDLLERARRFTERKQANASNISSNSNGPPPPPSSTTQQQSNLLRPPGLNSNQSIINDGWSTTTSSSSATIIPSTSTSTSNSWSSTNSNSQLQQTQIQTQSNSMTNNSSSNNDNQDDNPELAAALLAHKKKKEDLERQQQLREQQIRDRDSGVKFNNSRAPPTATHSSISNSNNSSNGRYGSTTLKSTAPPPAIQVRGAANSSPNSGYRGNSIPSNSNHISSQSQSQILAARAKKEQLESQQLKQQQQQLLQQQQTQRQLQQSQAQFQAQAQAQIQQQQQETQLQSEIKRRKELESSVLSLRRENQTLELDSINFKNKIQLMEVEDRKKTLHTSEIERINQELKLEVQDWEEEALEREKENELKLIGGIEPISFDKIDNLEKAYDILKVSRTAPDQHILDVYKSLLVTDHALAKKYHGAFYLISTNRSSPFLYPHFLSLLQTEISSYLSTLSIPLQPSLRMFLDELKSRLLDGGKSVGVETDELKKEKNKNIKLEERLSLLHMEFESKVKEVDNWKLKSEKAEKNLDLVPSKKASVLQADLEKVTEDKKITESKLTELTKKFEREEKETNKLKEKIDNLEQLIKQKDNERKELEEKLSSQQSGGNNNLNSTATTKILEQNKFVISRLATTVKTLNSELASKIAENGELMMRLASSSSTSNVDEVGEED